MLNEVGTLWNKVPFLHVRNVWQRIFRREPDQKRQVEKVVVFGQHTKFKIIK